MVQHDLFYSHNYLRHIQLMRGMLLNWSISSWHNVILTVGSVRVLHTTPILNQTKKHNLELLLTNSHLEYSMLQKTFFINRPKEWLQNNLVSGKVILLGEAAFSQRALENCRNSVLSLLSNDGFS
jgi:hypothetical protein